MTPMQPEDIREAAGAVLEALERVELKGEVGDVEDLDSARHDLQAALAQQDQEGSGVGEGVANELRGLNQLADGLDDDAARTLRAAVNRLVQRLYPRPNSPAPRPVLEVLGGCEMSDQELVTCECCEKRLPGECAATGVEGESLCGACVANLDAPIIKAAFKVVDAYRQGGVLGPNPMAELKAAFDDAYQPPATPPPALSGPSRDELALRLADAYDVVYTATPKDENGDVDGFLLEDLPAPFDSTFLTVLDHALEGEQVCMDDAEFAAKRAAALEKHGKQLGLSEQGEAGK